MTTADHETALVTQENTARGQRAARAEIERLVELHVVQHLVPSDVAYEMKWNVKRVRYYLEQPEVQQLIKERRDNVDQHAAYGASILNLALPELCRDQVDIARSAADTKDRLAAIKQIQNLVMAPKINAEHNTHTSADTAAAHMGKEIGIAIGSLIRSLGERRVVGDPDNLFDNPHLHKGEEVAAATSFIDPKKEGNGSG